MFTMQVTRTKELPMATLGFLTINGARECFTLEPEVREVAGQPVASWKIAGKTAIPVGTYNVTIDFSPKFGQAMPLLEGIPDFAEVRIHPGNTDADTEGCFLLGLTSPGGDFIGNSRAAFDSFFPKLQAAISAGDTPTITVTNAF